MGLFSKILGKLGIGKKEEEAPEAAAPVVNTPVAPKPAAAPTPVTPAKAVYRRPATSVTAAPKAPAVTPMSEVDVLAKLEAMSVGKDLDWKVSIVDLLKLLELDSSLAARQELADELGCPADQKSDSARMNVWLHKMVLKKIAENGGNIPQDLLD